MKREPGGPNIISVRGVLPRAAWHARSCEPRQASVSEIVSAMRMPLMLLTGTYPSSSLATTSAGLSKNADLRMEGGPCSIDIAIWLQNLELVFIGGARS